MFSGIIITSAEADVGESIQCYTCSSSDGDCPQTGFEAPANATYETCDLNKAACVKKTQHLSQGMFMTGVGAEKCTLIKCGVLFDAVIR